MQNNIQPEPAETPQTAETEPDAQAVRHITERLNEITTRSNSVKRRFRTTLILFIVCFVPCLGLGLILIQPGKSYGPNLIILFQIVVVAEFLRRLYALALATPKFDTFELTQTGEVQAIAPLFAALEITPSIKHQQAIIDALTTLLPQMKASDSHLLSPWARKMINLWLKTTLDYPTPRDEFYIRCMAALKALEQVGDSSAIPIVERVANRKGRTPAQEKIKQAAIECLPMLRAHCEGVEARQTLLRASHSEDSRPDTLLRPASHSAQMNAAELLRGAEPPGEEGGRG